jgi:tRNA-(ms[2]io[6]A)-hydroxylase
MMLSLKSETNARWLAQVDEDLDSILIDHAHCEKKAAGTAMHLLVAYIDHRELCREMTTIVNEELEHFHMVLEVLDRRGTKFTKLQPSSYGKRLHEYVRKPEPDRAVDRLLIAGLIEARSCERFAKLAEHVQQRDAQLSDFYSSLFESEARHHATYVQLARHYASEKIIKQRLDELSSREAEIIEIGDPFPRMHS